MQPHATLAAIKGPLSLFLGRKQSGKLEVSYRAQIGFITTL